MRPGQIVTVDWRDGLTGSGEPTKRRPGIVVSSPRFFGSGLPLEIIVPLTGHAILALPRATTSIEPTAANGCTKTSYALSWNVQCVPHARLTETTSHITDEQLSSIRAQIAACVGG